MTGRETRQELAKVLDELYAGGLMRSGGRVPYARGIGLLSGVICLTPAEQEKVRQFWLRGHKDECVPLVCDCGWREALALLAPEPDA